MNTLAGNFFTTDGTGVGLDGNVFNTQALQGAASLTSSLAGAATEYAFSGQAKLNVLDLSIFGQQGLSGGILELGIGDGGSLFEIGQGGYKADIGTIATTMGGLRDVLKVSDAKFAGGGSNQLADLNLVNYSAIAGNLGLASDIWNDVIQTRYEDLDDGHYGYYNHGQDPTTIVLNDDLKANDRDTAAMLAAAGAHEGTHLYERMFTGSTTEASAHRAGRAVYTNLVQGAGVARELGISRWNRCRPSRRAQLPAQSRAGG